MNDFVPRGYLTLEKALEHFGRLKHADKWEAEKASSKREFQRLLFAADLSAEVLTDDGILHSLRSSIWGSVEAERIFETGRASISVGDIYFPDTMHGPVFIKQSSIDALFDDDSDDPSQSSDSQHESQEGAETPQLDAETPDTPEIPEIPEIRKEKRARETQEKYKRWYNLAQEIKKEPNKTHPTEIASAIAKREKGSTERGVNALNIRRRLDQHYPGWAEPRPSAKVSAKVSAK